MKKLLLNLTILTVLLTTYSCSNETHLFAGKQEQNKIANHQDALVGQWVLDAGDSSQFVLGIEAGNTSLSLQTPNGESQIQSIRCLGDLGMVIELQDGETINRVIAKFKSYQKTTLVVMNLEGVELGYKAELPLTFKKVKEEAVLTASSKDQ